MIHVGRQAMIAHLSGHMLLRDSEYGQFHRIGRNGCSEDLIRLRELGTTCLEILGRAETTLVMMGRTTDKCRIAHTSGLKNTTRERCIRVAAIIIVTRAGVRNCCGSSDIKYATAAGRPNIPGEVRLNGCSPSADGREKPYLAHSKWHTPRA